MGSSYIGNPPYNNLVICLGEEHRHKVIEAFQLPGRYETMGQMAPTGIRFHRIIIFTPRNLSEQEQHEFNLFCNDIRTYTKPGGTVICI